MIHMIYLVITLKLAFSLTIYYIKYNNKFVIEFVYNKRIAYDKQNLLVLILVTYT